MVKLKRGLKYGGNVYFQPVCPHIIYQALTYLKSNINFYKDASVKKGLSSKDMFNFPDFVEMQR